MRSIIFAFLLLMTPLAADAAFVKSVKGKKVLIDLDGTQLMKGDILRVIDETGRVTGLVKIKSIKTTSAVGLLKGRAAVGSSLEPKTKEKKTPDPSMAQTTENQSFDQRYGFIVGYNMANADVTIGTTADEETLSLSGSGFSAKGLADFHLFSKFWFRGMAGLEQLMLGGANNDQYCGGECTAEINYLTLDLWGRAVFGEMWAGAGFDILLPISKSSTALKESSISNTSIIAIGGGYDINLSGGSKMPIQVEYNIYPPNEKVKATAIALRVGYTF